MRQIDFAPRALLMHYGVTEPAFADPQKGDANEVFGGAVWTETSKTSGQVLWKDAPTYAAAALKAFAVPADYTQAGSSAAGIAFQVAVEKIKAAPPLSEAQRAELVKALEGVDVQTFYGRVKFATDGEFYHSNVGLSPLTIQIQQGKVMVVGPAKDAAAKPLYPMTPWTKR
jgi:branched-chain amino acid transport system substrate-binding protein